MSILNRAPFYLLPPPAECLAIIIGTLELVPFGMTGLSDPASFAEGYGLPITNKVNANSKSEHRSPDNSAIESDGASASSHRKASEKEFQIKKGLVTAIAARNIQNGILLLTFGVVLKHRTSLGITVLSGIITTVADVVIVKSYGLENKVMGHYIGIFNSVVIGGILLFWKP